MNEQAIARQITVLQAHYPGATLTAENVAIFVEVLAELPEWAISEAVQTWTKSNDYLPRNPHILAREAKRLVEQSTPAADVCDRCSHGWIETTCDDDQGAKLFAVYPCPLCRVEQYERWKDGHWRSTGVPGGGRARGDGAAHVSELRQTWQGHES